MKPIKAILRTDRTIRLVYLGLALAVVGLFVLAAQRRGGTGFPLDDAWIHQTYARNLARNGRLEFAPGVVSAGSTAPLWTILLSIGYLLRLPYLLWAYLLGVISLWWSAVMARRLWLQLWPAQADVSWAIGICVLLTWPLIWAAASGMETLLFVALGLHILVYLNENFTLQWHRSRNDSPPAYRQAAVLGVMLGALFLVRPDAIVLASLVGLALLLSQRLQVVALFVGALLLPLLPYFAFNLLVSGTLWPNTLYAKQIEYTAVLMQPLWARLTQLLYLSLGGPAVGWRGLSAAHLLLLPGIIASLWWSLRHDFEQRRLFQLLPLLWAGGHIFLYAWRLPVTYQHGRYLFAAMPVWLLFGVRGWQVILTHLVPDLRLQQLAKLAASLTFAVMLLVFLLLGGQAYASDVAFIEGEMVAVGEWLAENTPETAVIATHDIGAIGYFAERPLLDLAGLISPEVAPLLANETALTNYILANPVDYLVTAPGWPYEALISTGKLTLVHTTDHPWTVAQGVNNMTVYRFP